MISKIIIFFNFSIFLVVFCSSSMSWSSSNHCLDGYLVELSKEKKSNDENLLHQVKLDNLNAELAAKPSSHFMMVVFGWLKKEFSGLEGEYENFLISLKKVGVDNKLVSNILIANTLYNKTLKSLQDVNSELNKKDVNAKKLKQLSESLKSCSLKMDTCVNDLMESVTDAKNQIDQLTLMSNSIKKAIESLETVRKKIDHIEIQDEQTELLLQAIQGQINRFESNLSIVASFKKQLDKSLVTALFYIHDTYPQILHDLKVADARGAELDIIMKDHLSMGKSKTSLKEALEKPLSATASEVINQIEVATKVNVKTLLFRSMITSKQNYLDGPGWHSNWHPNMALFQPHEIIRIFEAYLKKTTELKFHA